YPGEPGGCGHPLLHHRWQASSRMAAWPLSVCVTRPNRVRLRYGSRVRLRQASSGESLHRPLARLPVEWVITGQAPFSLQDQPGLSWHSIHRGFCDVCDDGSNHMHGNPASASLGLRVRQNNQNSQNEPGRSFGINQIVKSRCEEGAWPLKNKGLLTMLAPCCGLE